MPSNTTINELDTVDARKQKVDADIQIGIKNSGNGLNMKTVNSAEMKQATESRILGSFCEDSGTNL
jgi:hypothetical protein